jgi:hypothetical protein
MRKRPHKSLLESFLPNFLDNQHVGLNDLQPHAKEIHRLGQPVDPVFGLQGVRSDGKPSGFVFTDQRLHVTKRRERTIITFHSKERP